LQKSQHQQQPSYLLLQQSQQQPLLLIQQPQEQSQQKLILQSKQQPGLIVQASNQPETVQERRSQSQITNLNTSQDPLRIFVPILPIAESQKRIDNVRLKSLKSSVNFKPIRRLESSKIVKLNIPIVKEPEENEEPLKIEDPPIHQEYVSSHIGFTPDEELGFIQEFPSTSHEVSIETSKAIDSDNADDAANDDDCAEDASEDMKEIYTRIDYGGYQCNICQLTRLDRRSMLFHISGQHSHLRPFKCGSCDKTFKRKYSLKVHQLSHNVKSAVETYPCGKCNYRTPNKVSLRYHYYRVHTNEFRFTCEHCGKRFKVKRELADHLVTHSGIQHMCDICGKLYRGEHLLRAHRRLHLDLYKFQCLMCKKKLATEEGLRNHTKLHNRIYECDECGMKFPSKYNLIKHRNVHTREQAFPCPECGKVFADQPTQKVHSLIHAGLKPYRCNVCGLGFTQRTPMMLHWKKKHPGETDPPPPVILKNILKSIEEQNGRRTQQRK
jgi:NAD-dependent SIR2 family protein deacetylase